MLQINMSYVYFCKKHDSIYGGHFLSNEFEKIIKNEQNWLYRWPKKI